MQPSRGSETRYLRPRIRKALEAYGCKVWTTPGSAVTGKGPSDLKVLIDGVFISIEVKNAYGNPSTSQLREIMEIREHGGYAFIARSVEAAATGIQLARKGHLHMATDEFELDLSFLDGPSEVEEKPEVAGTDLVSSDAAWRPGSDEPFDFGPSTDDGPEGGPPPVSIDDLLGDLATESTNGVVGLSDNVGPTYDIETSDNVNVLAVPAPSTGGDVTLAEALRAVADSYGLLSRAFKVLANAYDGPTGEAPKKRGRKPRES